MSGPSHKREQQERKDVITNEQKLRPGDHEPSTMFQMANLDTGVTPSRVGKSYVSGSEQAVQYDIPSGPWSSDYARLADEPPLGYAIDAQEPVGTFAEVQASLSANQPRRASAQSVLQLQSDLTSALRRDCRS